MPKFKLYDSYQTKMETWVDIEADTEEEAWDKFEKMNDEGQISYEENGDHDQLDCGVALIDGKEVEPNAR